MKTFKQLKTRALVALIFSLILLACTALVYQRMYRIVQYHGGIPAAFQHDLTTSLIYFGFSIAWLFLGVTSFAVYAKTTRYYGNYVGAILGRLALIIEAIGYVVATVFLIIL